MRTGTVSAATTLTESDWKKIDYYILVKIEVGQEQDNLFSHSSHMSKRNIYNSIYHWSKHPL